MSDKLKILLDKEVKRRDDFYEVSETKPDPILIAREYKDEIISLICALFAYGNAKQIVKFLKSLDFQLLNESEDEMRKFLNKSYYRFQNSEDVINFFIVLKRVKEIDSLNAIFLKGYKKENSVLDGLNILIETLYSLNSYRSRGYKFLLSNVLTTKSKSTYKRWNMYLRWMVRSDNIDLGLWKGVNRRDLLIPLDTHTFNVSRSLGLLTRKSYDLKAVIQLTEKLKTFDKNDPVKYDFALYRIGQERDLSSFKVL